MALRRVLLRLSWAAPIVLAFGCARPLTEPPITGDFAIVDVTVVPMDTERLDAHRTVVVADGRIKAVLPADSTRLAPSVRQNDGRGRYLIPGRMRWNDRGLVSVRAGGDLGTAEVARADAR